MHVPLPAWIKCLPQDLGVAITPPWKTGPQSVGKLYRLFHKKEEWILMSPKLLMADTLFVYQIAISPLLPPLLQDPKAKDK